MATTIPYVFGTLIGGPVAPDGPKLDANFQALADVNPSNSATANTVFAGPASGGAAAPSFRTLAQADLTSAFGGAQDTVTGTTAGSIVIAEVIQGASFKKVVAYFSGYSNSTGTPQTWTFPVAFTHTASIVVNSTSVSSVNQTTLTLPVNMASANTGNLIIEGF